MSDQAEAPLTPPWLESLAGVSHDRCTFCNEVGSFPHTCNTPATELVAIFQPEGEEGVVSVVIGYRAWDDLWHEIGAWACVDVEGPIGVITLSRKPVGHVESLPEHPGW